MEVAFSIAQEQDTVVSTITSKTDTCPLISAGQHQIGMTIAVDVGCRDSIHWPILCFGGQLPW